MSKSHETPDRLFDRTWRPRHPFRPRISGLRRWAMGGVLFILCVVIGGYWYITDSNRVRNMAETYLATLLGGPVKVDSATLSIFEGLRLDGVKLYVDKSNAPDSLLFSADSFLIQYSPRALLAGKIEATKIVAVDPRVHVIENADTGHRNYSRLAESRSTKAMPSTSSSNPIILPEIVLRNAQVDYTRLRNGAVIESSSMNIEGQLTPLPESKVYSFAFQSRGQSAEIGPIISGRMVMDTGQITASLQNFEFGPDVKSMLPIEVQDWWQQHDLTGRVNTDVNYIPPAWPGAHAQYRVQIELQGVTLQVHPEEWMSEAEHQQLRDINHAFDAMRIAGLNQHFFIDHVAEMVEPLPLNLNQVHGRFIFSDNQNIQIDDLNGWVEEMPFKISGTIMGYTPAAEAHIRIGSSDLHDIEIPAAPRYITSLPPAVREIYDRFKPRGICRYWVGLDRDTPGARPRVSGEVDIIDGNFMFDKFPYPLRKATGKIILTHDPQTDEESIQIDRIRGRGVEGGPNADSFVEVNGSIGPIGPEAHVDVIVAAQHISNDPVLIAAFPPATRKALTVFDAPGKGEFPKFTGDFVCSIIRLRGRESHWVIDTNIHLDDAAGSLVAFPYPLTGLSGDLKIHDDNLELININSTKGDASVRIDGRVSWPRSDDMMDNTTPVLKPNLTIVAKNVPLDDDLLNALPAAQKTWLKKIGAAGLFDLDGTVTPGDSAANDLNCDFNIALHDGTLWPVDGKPTVADVQGDLHLNNDRLTIGEIHGKRGDSDVEARGEVSWPDQTPMVVMQADAKDVVLDSALHSLLPEVAQKAWDAVGPQGTLDASLNYSGGVGDPNQPASGYEIILTPKKLSATAASVPYRLDDLSGTVTVLPDKVLLKDISAHHGDAKIKFSGSGTTGKVQTWDFALSGKNVPLDDDFSKGVPQSLANLIKALQLSGKMDFDFSSLHMTIPSDSASTAVPDTDFNVTLTMNGDALDIGVPLTNVTGTTQMNGSSRNGKLSTLTGNMDISSLSLAGQPITRFKAELLKTADEDQLTIGKMECAVAGGGMAGQVDYAFPDTGPSRYAVNLTLRDADVRKFAVEQNIQGTLSASFALEGTENDPSSRRGRGDVIVTGRDMYHIPLMLGLMQITNLALPITSPFTEASARYNIDGQRVTFEDIELRSKDMLMQGDGHLDFDTKQVAMRFVTDSPSAFKIPIIGDLITQARHELLQIQVRGTLQQPTVSAQSFATLTTTVDQVFKSEDKPVPDKKPR